VVGLDHHISQQAQRIIDILLSFVVSPDPLYQFSAYWALKDYVLLNHDNLIPDITDITLALEMGCIN
jgi:hypothetical protein